MTTQPMDVPAPAPARRARPAVMTMTDRAAARVKSIMATKSADVIGLRIGVKKGGCAGMEYTMDWTTTVGKFDEVVEHDGARVIIDPKAVIYLLGTRMDYATTKLTAQFVFDNPNQTSACGCGESVTLTPAKLDPIPA